MFGKKIDLNGLYRVHGSKLVGALRKAGKLRGFIREVIPGVAARLDQAPPPAKHSHSHADHAAVQPPPHGQWPLIQQSQPWPGQFPPESTALVGTAPCAVTATVSST